MARALAVAVALATAAGPASGGSGTEMVSGSSNLPAPRQGATGGEVLYLRYCASCHGTAGGGDGPVAAEMRVSLPDLTRLAARNHGKFDERGLVAVIDGRRAVAAHGSRAMPVWGDVFDAELTGRPHAVRQNLLRSRVLVDYLRSIQLR